MTLPLFGGVGPIPLVPFPNGEGEYVVRGAVPLLYSPATVFRDVAPPNSLSIVLRHCVSIILAVLR